MSELIANEDYQVEATSLGAWLPGDPNSPTDMTFTLIKATKANENNKKILVNNMNWIVIPAACTFAGHTHVAGGSAPVLPPGFNTGAPINATAQDCKCDNLPVMRENDTGTCNGTFTNNSSGATVGCQCSFKISDAGQALVRGK